MHTEKWLPQDRGMDVRISDCRIQPLISQVPKKNSVLGHCGCSRNWMKQRRQQQSESLSDILCFPPSCWVTALAWRFYEIGLLFMVSFELNNAFLFMNDYETDTSELCHLGLAEGTANSLWIASVLPFWVSSSHSLFTWLSLFFSFSLSFCLLFSW